MTGRIFYQRLFQRQSKSMVACLSHFLLYEVDIQTLQTKLAMNDVRMIWRTKRRVCVWHSWFCYQLMSHSLQCVRVLACAAVGAIFEYAIFHIIFKKLQAIYLMLYKRLI